MNIIWNLTRACPYNCKICSVCAVTVKDINKKNTKKQLERTKGELNFSAKKDILIELAKYFDSLSIDFSGGDPLFFEEDCKLIKQALDLEIDCEISATGHNLTKEKLRSFNGKLSRVEFTLDIVPHKVESTRQQIYHLMNIQGIRRCLEENIPTRVCTVLKKDNIAKDDLAKLYELLSDLKVKEWELIRFYPCGRGHKLNNLAPTEQQYTQVIKYCLSLQRKNGPKIEMQHSFYNILKNLGLKARNCEAVSNQIGILPDGTVLACPWALNEKGEPLENSFVLGKMPKQKIKEIMNTEKAKKWTNEKSANFRCRVKTILKSKYFEKNTEVKIAQEKQPCLEALA